MSGEVTPARRQRGSSNRPAEQKLTRLNRLYAMLSASSEAMVRIRDREQLFAETCRIAVEHGAFRLAWVGLVDADTGWVRPVAWSGVAATELKQLQVSARDEPEGRGVTGTAIATGRTDFCNDVARDERLRPWRAAAVELGYGAVAAFPLRQGPSVVGALTVNAAEAGFFDADELAVLERLAANLSFALEAIDQATQIHFQKTLLECQTETALDGIAVITTDGRILAMNRRCLAMWDLPEEVLRTRDRAAAFRRQSELVADPEWLEARNRYLYEHPDEVAHDELPFKDGRVYERYSAPVKSAEGVYYGRVWYFRDISRRKRAEAERAQALALSQAARAEAEALLAATTQIMSSLDLTTTLNSVLDHMVWLSESDFAGVLLFEEDDLTLRYAAVRGSDTEPLRHVRVPVGQGLIGTAAETGQPITIDEYEPDPVRGYRQVIIAAGMRSGLYLPLRSRTKVVGVLVAMSRLPAHYHAGRQRLMSGLAEQAALAIEHAHEIAERQRAEEALRASEQRFRELFDEAPVGYHEIDTEGRVTRVNQTELAMLGYTAAEMLGRPIWDFADDPEALRRAVLSRIVEGGPANVERTYRRKDGTLVPVLIQSRRLRAPDGRILGLRTTVQDVTELRQAQEAVRTSEALFRELFDEAPVAYCEIDAAGRIVRVNRTLLDLLGYAEAEVVGDYLWKLSIDPERSERTIRDRFAGRAPSRVIERTYRRKDGRLINVVIIDRELRDSAGRLVGLRSSWTDVTERRRLEEQLRQAQKMEAVGQLAGGIAHDFNNLLTIISGHAELQLLGRSEGDALWEAFQEIKGAADRATALTRQLLAFGRRQMLAPKVLNVNAIVAEVERLLARLIGENIQLITALDPGLPSTWVDPTQLEQVILNLVVNARDAMPRGGRLYLTTSTVELGASVSAQEPVRPGRYVRLSVSDTGTGIDEETLPHIFEPFFTTKELGKGTGLGLATVYGIVRQSEGYVWVRSAPSAGTTFDVDLPVYENAALPSGPEAAAGQLQPGSETILLVEDEAGVRALSRRVLRLSGYTVIEADAGATAIELFERHDGPIHLLLTDVVLPALSGRELAEQLRRRRPDLRVLYMSGYTDDIVLRHGVSQAGTAFVEKPFTPESLSRRVRELLDAPPS